MTMIKLQYVKEYIDKTGKVRRYLRRKGKPSIPLPGLPGSDEFMAAYKDGLAAIVKPKPKHGDGTIGSLVLSFYQSSAFSNLAPSSQKRYQLVLDKFAAEDGHRLVRDMPRRVAVSIIEEIGEKTPGMANLSASVLRRLFAYAIKKELRNDNPFSGIEPYKLGSHHTWTEAEIEKYRETWPIGTRERLAFDLLLYTGQRVGDVAAMRHADHPQRCHPCRDGKDRRRAFHSDSSRLARVDRSVPVSRSDAHRLQRSADIRGGVIVTHPARRARRRTAETMQAARPTQERTCGACGVRIKQQRNRIDERPPHPARDRTLHRKGGPS